MTIQITFILSDQIAETSIGVKEAVQTDLAGLFIMSEIDMEKHTGAKDLQELSCLLERVETHAWSLSKHEVSENNHLIVRETDQPWPSLRYFITTRASISLEPVRAKSTIFVESENLVLIFGMAVNVYFFICFTLAHPKDLARIAREQSPSNLTLFCCSCVFDRNLFVSMEIRQLVDQELEDDQNFLLSFNL